MNNYVVGFLFSENRENVVLILKLRPVWQKGLYNGVGGKVEQAESPEVAMVREFYEETGVKTKTDEWSNYAHIVRPSGYDLHVFSAFSDQLYAVRSVEREVVEFFNVSNLPQNLISNLKWLIPLALDKDIDFSEPIFAREYFHEEWGSAK